MSSRYVVIRNFMLSGVFAYAIFGIYALTLAPVVTEFFEFGEKNLFIGFFGFFMLFAEFFALNFKLKMIRLRSEEKRIQFKKETGKNIIPSSSPIVFFGVFMRIAFHVGIVMVSMTALGFACSESEMSVPGQIAIIAVILLDIAALIYLYYKADFYSDPPQNKKDLAAEIKEGDDFHLKNKELLYSEKHHRMEMICDIVLHVYALMLFTSFWKTLNTSAINSIHEIAGDGDGAFAIGVLLFTMLFMAVMVGLMPMRIAYWIEDSMKAFTTRERNGMWLAFFLVAVFTCSPTIYEFIRVFLLKAPDGPLQSIPQYVGYIMSAVLFLLLLCIQVSIKGSKRPT